jgi:N-acetylmuramoyl-L-alanine amidase
MPWIEVRGGSQPLRFAAVALILCVTSPPVAGALPQQSPVPAPPVAPGKPDLPSLPPPPANRLLVQPAFSVVIDAAHGGANTGARIDSNSLEKDVALALSIRLGSALAARGIAVVMTRDSDTDLPPTQRAGIANHALASACLIIHATASGSGVHLFTSSLTPVATPPTSSMVSWQTAQAVWVSHSLRLTSEIDSALGKAGIPTTLGVASIQPLDNLACPAVAVEIAPLTASGANRALAISDGNYQQRLLDALTAAILQWNTDWKQQP